MLVTSLICFQPLPRPRIWLAVSGSFIDMASEAVNTPVPPGEERFRRLAPPTPASPSDPAFARWTRSLALLTGLGLSEDESEALKEQKLMRRCEKWRDSTVENSQSGYSLLPVRSFASSRCFFVDGAGPIVRFMLQHVGALPVPPPPRPSPGSPSPTPLSEPNPTRYLPLPILCSPCRPYPSAGMFSRELSPETGGAIRLCGDYLRTKTKVEDTLAHELVHAWDWRKFEVDNTDPRAVACTEVRFLFTLSTSEPGSGNLD